MVKTQWQSNLGHMVNSNKTLDLKTNQDMHFAHSHIVKAQINRFIHFKVGRKE